MSGHSKWANIRLRKGAQDAKKSKVYGKVSREIIIAAREGGGSPDTNNRLRTAIEKARECGMPQDNIKRAIQRGTGEIESAALEEITYEGYGPGGVALMIQAMTENRNRTVGEVRSTLTRSGGNLGAAGCVSYLFENKGVIVVNKEGVDEDALMEAALEAGASDMTSDDTSFEITTPPHDVYKVKEALEAKGFAIEGAESSMVPATRVTVEGHEAQRVLKLLDALEDLEDVQEVFSNFDISEEEMEAALSGTR
jgi:YebC/PmpR family DNA-binding regulatory protein